MAREVQACRAKTHLARLLDAVERGETIVITRHGRRIAHVVAEAARRQQEIAQAIANIRALGREISRKRGPITDEEINRKPLRRLRQRSPLASVFGRSPDGPAVMALARRHRLTVYDAAYLELAMRQALPLATLDAALTRAARAQSVALLGSAPG